MTGETADLAPTSEMQDRRRLAQLVDGELTSSEQETGISFFSSDARFEIVTYNPSMVRSLLRHDYAKIEWVYVRRPDKRNKRVRDIQGYADRQAPDAIEGIAATLPLGALTIKGAPRNNNRPSKIITTPEDIENLGDVFDESTNDE